VFPIYNYEWGDKMANNKTIYIADDDENIRDAIKTFLDGNDFDTTAFATGDLLLAAFQKSACDLAILDVMMPGRSGFEICTELRKISTVPIIMLTARDSDIDYATGITLGSDDYFTKPFSAMSLVMRVKAIFRRIEFEASGNSKSGSAKINTFGDIMINGKSKTVTCKGTEIALTPNEYALLEYLMEHSDEAISREALLNHVWQFDLEIETRAVDDTIRRLRKKLLDSSVSIEAVWGFGFRLKVYADE
jgi:DNA-binding response OmpR family regulator